MLQSPTVLACLSPDKTQREGIVMLSGAVRLPPHQPRDGGSSFPHARTGQVITNQSDGSSGKRWVFDKTQQSAFLSS